RALSVMIHVATATISSSLVPPKRPIQSRALKPIAGVAGSRTITLRPALRRCSITMGATSLDVSSTTRLPPHFREVGIVTDVVLNPPEPAKTIPWDEPNEPSKHKSGFLPPPPQLSRV